MEIPASFKTAIAKELYTDTIQVMAQEEQLDAEGGAKRVATTVGEPIKANAQPVGDELRKALLGDNIEAEYKITTPPEIGADKGTLIQMNGETYEVVDFKEYDSHAELLIKRSEKP